MRPLILASLLTATALPALAQEVNVYSHRQPELIQPLLDAFTAETGITVNSSFVDKGMVERLQAEGTRSPADLVLTVDVARLGEAEGRGRAAGGRGRGAGIRSRLRCATTRTSGSA